jgi:predicted Fe-S protein YdhL (DUF1289 family)
LTFAARIYNIIKAITQIDRRGHVDIEEIRLLSPCMGVCSIDIETGYCKGCLRTLEEISSWIYYNREQRIEVLQKTKRRGNVERIA